MQTLLTLKRRLSTVVVLVMVFVLIASCAVIYFNRNLIAGQRVSVNAYHGTRAAEAASNRLIERISERMASMNEVKA